MADNKKLQDYVLKHYLKKFPNGQPGMLIQYVLVVDNIDYHVFVSYDDMGYINFTISRLETISQFSHLLEE